MAVIWEKKPEILSQVLHHIATVNEISEDEVSNILDKSLWDWVEMSDAEWKIRIDPKLISRCPQLEGLEL